MPFPEFEHGKRKILFFSRGRGRGHAIPDIEIVGELSHIRPDVDVHFVSYGTGARTLEEFGFSVVDLGLEDAGSITDTTVMAGKLIRWLQPELVISHEEFAALPAAKVFDTQTIAILDYFLDPAKLAMQSLRCADQVLFTDHAGLYEEPPFVAGRVQYVGPILRKFAYTRDHWNIARQELSIEPDAFVVAVLPGSWTEVICPVADLVLRAFDLIKVNTKRLIWVAGSDLETITELVGDRNDVTVFEKDWAIDRIMVASDVAVTKMSRGTLLELQALGVPSVSLSHGLNLVDAGRAAQIPTNRTELAAHLTAEELAQLLMSTGQRTPCRPAEPSPTEAAGWAALFIDHALKAS